MGLNMSIIELHPHTKTVQQAKFDLAAAYQIVSELGMDDLTYTHLSARLPTRSEYFIYPFGLLFEEVTPECLLTVNLDGTIQDGSEYQYNQTGYTIHGSIYECRSDVNAIFHLHTPATVAVSAHPKGLLPLSQWALHFYNRVGYHDYQSLALHKEGHQEKILADLGAHNILMMRNHGIIACGKTIQEALFYCYHLEQACKTQCVAGHPEDFIMPNEQICQQTVTDLLSFETDLGRRDWLAWIRRLGLDS
jgi:ribulose-5-phosphate 4-epimerase/fuculose-1-phosphate aldolase